MRRWALVWLLAAATAVLGWREFWFLCDDAFIAFRYAHNLLAGRGLVWNPAPFHPVEGYTSFSWVVLLAGVWKLTGLDPEAAAGWLSLGFGLLTLALGARLLARMPLPPALERQRLPLAACALLATAGNRTFATWLSSGLETALFTACITGWLVAALGRPKERAGPWLARLSALAAATALTRPGGILTCAATVGIGAVHWLLAGRRRSAAHLAGLLPLGAVAGHLMWRRATYGDWVPNTYYAKHVASWPESGWRYLASFGLEYGLWLWTPLVLGGLWRWLRTGPDLPALARTAYPGAIAAATLLAHFAYYTFEVGGDHFEYRIYHHLVLPIFALAIWSLAWLCRSAPAAYALFALFVAVSLPIGWVQWRAQQDPRPVDAGGRRVILPVLLTEHMPAFTHPVIRHFDDWQWWLNTRGVCLRQQSHVYFLKKQHRRYPLREVGERISWERRGVLARAAVGYPGWTLPNIAIIDEKGLNDRIVARFRVIRLRRRMAHDRFPPPGYTGCFMPNVTIRDDVVHVGFRPEPLSDERIRLCEQVYMEVAQRRPLLEDGALAPADPTPPAGAGDRP